MFKKSLAVRILFLHLFFIIIPITFYFLFLFYWEYEQKIAFDIQRLRNIGIARAAYLNDFINDQFSALNIFEELTNLRNPHDESDRTPDFIDMASKIKHHQIGFFVRQPNNHYIVKYSSDPRYIGDDLTFRGYIQEAAVNEYSAYLYIDYDTFLPEFITTKAVHSRDDYKILGIIGATYSASRVMKTLTDTDYFQNKQTISLLTQDKIVFASSDPRLVLVSLVPQSEARISQLKYSKQFGHDKVPSRTLNLQPYPGFENVFTWSENNQVHIAFITPVANNTLFIWMDIEKAVIAKPYLHATWVTVIVLLVITLLGCLMTILISALVSKTFNELINVMDRVSQGDLSARFQERIFGYEINKAGNTLNKVLDRLVSETKVAESEQLKTESVSKELKIGREIQKSILPQVIPHVAGLEMGVYSQPASEVSGDFYDAYVLGERLVIALAGTSGKGLFSCLYSVSLRSLLRAVTQKEIDPSVILAKTNALFHKDLQNTPLNIKTFIGFWNSASATLQYASANPSFGFVRRANGTFEPLAGSSGNMGIAAEASFTTYSLPLEPGAIVILYTGGVVDLQSASGMLYGETGLKAVVEQKNYLGAEELAKAISDDLFNFAAGAVQLEDMTVIVLKTKF